MNRTELVLICTMLYKCQNSNVVSRLCRMVEYCLETFSGLAQSVSRERKHEVNELGVGD